MTMTMVMMMIVMVVVVAMMLITMNVVVVLVTRVLAPEESARIHQRRSENHQTISCSCPVQLNSRRRAAAAAQSSEGLQGLGVRSRGVEDGSQLCEEGVGELEGEIGWKIARGRGVV